VEEYGRALEYIHAEYSRGFEKLLNLEKKSGSAAAGRKSPPARGKPGPAVRNARDARGRSSADSKIAGPEADADRFRVVLFRTDEEYQAFGREFLGGWTEHTNGMFVTRLKMLLILAGKKDEETYSVLFHEAFHQFLAKYIKNPPIWLNEGLATYYGTAQPTPRGLAWTRTPRFGWPLCRQALQFNAAIPLREVVHADWERFYDTTPVILPRYDKLIRRHFFYAESYTLIHMLLKDRTGLQRLQNYIRDLAADDGTNSAKITNKYFDSATCDRLSRTWAAYVNNRASARVKSR
jgi:hypothetical protein